MEYWDAQITAAESRGEARGRAAVLAEVAKLPEWIPDGGVGMCCHFCGACRWVNDERNKHADDCLWFQARAHAAGVAAPEA